MIERYIKNELTLKRWRRFCARKLSVYSSLLILFFLFLTFIAPMLSNSKPLYLNFKGKSYYPVLVDYHPKEFGITDLLSVDYRELPLSDGDSMIWTPGKWDPFESNENVDSYPSPPTKDNWLGTDDRGRDVFARLLYGFKYSIVYAVVVWLITTIVAIIVGGIMGYFGGKLDLIGQRVIEIIAGIPQFYLLLILISMFNPNLLMLIFVTSLFGWIGMSYYVRAEFLKNRKKEFTEAALALGQTTDKIIFKHILPNSLTPIITYAPILITGHIIGLASLDYLGFGLEVPTPSWGELLAQAQKNYTVAWWLAVFPSICLFVTLVLLNLIGDGIRDALDPRKT